MVQRLTYRRSCSYKTRSNKCRPVRVPGGKLAFHYIGQTAQPMRCGDCGCKLAGIPCVRPAALHRLSKRQKHVTRAYGGSRCAKCVRERILRAFLLEEQKIVKRVLRQRK